MQILSDDQRAALLKSLESAPDEVLLSAVREMKDLRMSIQKGFDDLKTFVGVAIAPVIAPTLSKFKLPPSLIMSPPVAPSEAAEVAPDNQLTLPEVEAPKTNVEPAGEAAYKVGGKNKDEILAFCKTPQCLEKINKMLGRGVGKIPETQSLLKRLWDLGLLKFDGTSYYNVN